LFCSPNALCLPHIPLTIDVEDIIDVIVKNTKDCENGVEGDEGVIRGGGVDFAITTHKC